ncbi:MAG: hypothetical protein LBH80_05110 [Prevotellaceae bacterium]|nr:hypothetical protein [Prevotellaceae bacterium]
MKTIPLNTNHQIRFRRWSRARYAVFASLKGNVTVGVVRSSIADSSLRKSCNSNGYRRENVLLSEDRLFDTDGSDKEQNAPMMLDSIFAVNRAANSATGNESRNTIIDARRHTLLDA